MFSNLRRILVAAGATPDDVLKMTVYMKDASVRDVINKEWIAMFPDAAARPARHSITNPHLAGDMLVQCVVTAVIGDPASS
jgi:enamine deaminase RidA (YjgF/YER057c/UK114 family)